MGHCTLLRKLYIKLKAKKLISRVIHIIMSHSVTHTVKSSR
jgi:hypothetical protein